MISYKRFTVDQFFGIGIRIKDTYCTLTDEEYENIDFEEQDFGSALSNACGKWYLPNFIIGTKVGYRLW
jgi:predicted double-glycine peptidase